MILASVAAQARTAVRGDRVVVVFSFHRWVDKAIKRLTEPSQGFEVK